MDNIYLLSDDDIPEDGEEREYCGKGGRSVDN